MADAHSITSSVDWRYLRRRSLNLFNLFGSALATLFSLFWLIWILWVTLSYGVSAFELTLFVDGTPAPGSEGGLANAIVGSLIMVALATFIGTPIGIMAGTYLAEFGRKGLIPGLIRFINDILLSAPSIVIGLFVYEIVVIRVGHFSGLAGALALAIIVLPVVIRTTEEMLRLVPNTLREAALAVARIAGETAPLLFTALNNQFWSTNLGQPMANLPVTIFQFAMSPYAEWHALAWAGSLLITLGVLALSIVARMLLAKVRTEGP
jgi:phosphate transport system permease protein